MPETRPAYIKATVADYRVLRCGKLLKSDRTRSSKLESLCMPISHVAIQMWAGAHIQVEKPAILAADSDKCTIDKAEAGAERFLSVQSAPAKNQRFSWNFRSPHRIQRPRLWFSTRFGEDSVGIPVSLCQLGETDILLCDVE